MHTKQHMEMYKKENRYAVGKDIHVDDIPYEGANENKVGDEHARWEIGGENANGDKMI